MNFEIHPSPMKDSEGRNLLYVRPLQGQHITLSELDEHCCEHAGLPRNKLTSVFNYFCMACAEFLADGKRIKTPMGVFSPRLSLKRQFAGLTRHSAQKYLDSLCTGDHPQLTRRLVGRTFIYEKCGQ